MKEIQNFFKKIGKNFDENTQDLVSKGLIDSVDIMNLVTEIEDFYGKELDFEFIQSENFENFKTIKIMLESALK